MSYKSNMGKVLLDLKKDLKNVQNTDKLTRTIATTLKATNIIRVHQEGRKFNGTPIGTLAESTFTSKKRAGKIRGTGRKVVLSDERVLQQDLEIQPIVGGWAVGVVNRTGRQPGPGELIDILEDKYGVFYGVSKSDEIIIDRLTKAFIKRNLP